MSKDKLMAKDKEDKLMVPEAPAKPAAPAKLTDEDRLTLQLAKSRNETALYIAKEALAKSETAEVTYKYVVLQLYMKYGLSPQDGLSENGDIIRGAVVPKPQGQP